MMTPLFDAVDEGNIPIEKAVSVMEKTFFFILQAIKFKRRWVIDNIDSSNSGLQSFYQCYQS